MAKKEEAQDPIKCVINAPRLMLEDEYLDKYLPDGLDMNVDDEVELTLKCKVRSIRNGKDYDGENHKSVELEVESVDGDDVKKKMRSMQGRNISMMLKG